MLPPARSSVPATATNSSSLAPTTLPTIFLPRVASSRAISAKNSTPRFFRFSGDSSPTLLHDLNTIAPPCTAHSSKISPRSAERAPDAFITDEPSSTPPSRIEVRSIPYFLLRAIAEPQAAASALCAESATDNFVTMTDTPILIAGAGAIGSVLGAMIHDAGHDVTLLG